MQSSEIGKVTSIKTPESIAKVYTNGNIDSADETANKINGGYSEKGISRTAVYKRSGKALANHSGWKGYFRPTNYTKTLE